MVFNFPGLFRFSYRWLANMRWTGRRVLIVLAFFIVYPLLELGIWLGLGLDNLLFRRFRKQPIRAPVFITGNFRSGTTLLHRLLAKDQQQFTTMAMWEILFAPSIAQRRIVAGMLRLHRWLGSPASRFLNRTERRWQEQNVMHWVSLREPEEDDYLLLHIWSALTTGLSAGLLDEAMPYTFFDQQLSPEDRERIMGFYRRSVQRHLYARRERPHVHYLAKNPALCPKLGTLLEHFPDAKIIYLVRNPLEVIPSFLSMMQFTWRVLGAPAQGSALRDYLLRMARHWYQYPLERLAQLPDSQYAIIKYDDLVEDPAGTITALYQRLGLKLNSDFAAVLQNEAHKAQSYKSRHAYSLGELGLNRQQIQTEFRDVFTRFDFDSEDEPTQAASGAD